MVYDFDKTLCRGYMQTPLFDAYGIDQSWFWSKTDEMIEEQKALGVTLDLSHAYLNLLLDMVEDDRLSGLNNAKLGKLGESIELFEGLPEYFTRTRELVAAQGHELEHYVITSGLKEMVVGSIGEHLDGIFGAEYSERNGIIFRVAKSLDFTQKTLPLFEINKGVTHDSSIDINARMPHKDRRVPFTSMLYFGDGETDIPAFSIIMDRDGKTFAVYDPHNGGPTKEAQTLEKEKRVNIVTSADYREGSDLSKFIDETLEKIMDSV